MKKIFINPDSGLLRAGWRILLFVVLFGAITSGLMLAVRALLGGLQKQSPLQFTLLAIGATIAIYIARRYLDKKAFASLGVNWDRFALLDVISGFVNAGIVMACVFVLMLSTGLIEFHGLIWWMEEASAGASFSFAALPVILTVFYTLTVVAWWEELAFRGYVFQNLVAGVGLVWSVVVTSLFFGVVHALNPGATILSSLIIAITTTTLIYAYLKTGQLWLPIGLHLGWNFFQSSVFGFAASGLTVPSLVSQSPVGPHWLSGGEFGAEGSVLLLPCMVLMFVMIHYWVRATRQPGQGPFEMLAR